MKLLSFCIGMMVLFLIGIIFRLPYAYLFLYGMLLILVMIKGYIPAIYRNLILLREHPTYTEQGESVSIKLTFQNSTIGYLPWVECREQLPLELQGKYPVQFASTIKGQSTQSIEYEITPSQRGYYQIGPLHTKTGDWFGFTLLRQSYSASNLTVYPRMHPLPRLLVRSQAMGSRRVPYQMMADPSQTIGIRPFQYGDRMRQVNWRASARAISSSGMDLLVNQTSPSALESFMVLLNLNSAEYQKFSRRAISEWGITVTASIVRQLAQNKYDVGCGTNGYDPIGDKEADFSTVTGRLESRNKDTTALDQTNWIAPMRQGYALSPILSHLARVQQQDAITFGAWMIPLVSQLPQGTTLVHVTPSITLPLIQTIHRQRKAGYQPIVILLEKHEQWEERASYAKQLGIPIRLVINEQQLAQLHLKGGL